MSDPEDFVQKRLHALREATDRIVPAAGFDDWIVQRVQRRAEVGWIEGAWRAGRWALAAAAIAAAASLVLAVESADLLDDRVMAAFDLVEVDALEVSE